MQNKKRRYLFLLIALIVLAAGISAAVYAKNSSSGIKASGVFSSKIADRISVVVENTDFTMKNKGTDPETYTLSFNLKIKKTQPDFYVKINSVKLNNIVYDNIVFNSLNSYTDNKVPYELILKGENGKCPELAWKGNVSLSFSGSGTYHPELQIEFISGTSIELAEKKQISIPLKVTVES